MIQTIEDENPLLQNLEMLLDS
ncbi:hypothetical protein CCP3SC1_650023 [Gammaproteobacteria bacterium]